MTMNQRLALWALAWFFTLLMVVIFVTAIATHRGVLAVAILPSTLLAFIFGVLSGLEPFMGRRGRRTKAA